MYYFLIAENVSLEEYDLIIELFNKLKDKKITLHEIFDIYIPRIDDNYRNWTINKASFFEFFSFLNYCNTNNINFGKVKPIKDFNIVLVDWKLILLNDNNKVLTKKDYIITLRNLFYMQLFETLSLFTNILIPDRKENYEFNKLAFIYLLFKNYNFKKIQYILWDITIIFITNKDYITYVKDILKDKYDKFVLKSITSEMWKWVYTFDINKENYDQQITEILNSYLYMSMFVIPFFDIEKEYRLYYTYINWKIIIYTAKYKHNENIKEAFEKWSFEMYKNLNVSFSYFDKDNFTNKQLSFIENIIKWVWWKVWVLEFIQTKDNELYLMEINHLWGLLTCNKKDIDFLNFFYNNIYIYLLNKK